jgi:LacI family transcriptional regulator
MPRVQEVDWQIPKHLSIIGFDDIIWSNWTTPSLTTIAQPKKTLVNKAVQILLRRVKAIEEDVRIKAESIEIAPTLIPRKSVTQPFQPVNELSKV